MKNLTMFLFLLVGLSFSQEGFEYPISPGYVRAHAAHHFPANFMKYNFSHQFTTHTVRTMFVEWSGSIKRDRLDRKILRFQVTEFDSTSGKTCWREVILDCGNAKGYLGSPHPVNYSNGNPQREANGVVYENVVAHNPNDPRYSHRDESDAPTFYYSRRMDMSGSAVSFYDEEFPLNGNYFCSDHK